MDTDSFLWAPLKQPTPPAPSRTFHRFMDLPVELRLDIWERVFDQPTVLDLDEDPSTGRAITTAHGPAGSVGLVCREAREIMEKKYQNKINTFGGRTIRFDVKKTILSINGDRFFWFIQMECIQGWRFVAIPSFDPQTLRRALRRMTRYNGRLQRVLLLESIQYMTTEEKCDAFARAIGEKPTTYTLPMNKREWQRIRPSAPCVHIIDNPVDRAFRQ